MSDATAPNDGGNTFVSELARLGFFSRVRPERIAEAERETATFPFPDVVRRLFHADAEELAEGCVLEFIASTREFLALEGVRIDVTFRPQRSVPSIEPVDPDAPPPMQPLSSMRISMARGAPPVGVSQTYGDSSYTLRLGARDYVIWSQSDRTNSWMAAAVRTIALLNELLAAHGSRERAWGISGGNDMFIAFATPEQAALINARLGERDRLHDGHGL